jgi:2-iminobutanoate/2-iminopropanoate deaminase
MKTAFETIHAPAPIGPYSQAILSGGLLFVSGQVAINPVNQEVVVGSIEEEAHQVMHNIQAILKEAGMGFEHILNSTIYLKNFDHFKNVNAIYEAYLSKPYPARTTVEVSRLPKDVNLEIAVVASKA